MTGRSGAADVQAKTALVVGASRTIGLGISRELVARGWNVIGTVRGAGRTALHDLADASAGMLAVEVLDMTDDEQLTALTGRLGGARLDLVFVNGAVANEDDVLPRVPTATFVEVMVTNALSPMRVIDALKDLVPPTGTLGVMSSTQGSVSLNTNGGHEVYRASKSALNQLMRSFAAREADSPRTLLLVDPGWVRTELGGEGAALSVEESVPGVVDTILAHEGEGGLHFVDHRNQPVPWQVAVPGPCPPQPSPHMIWASAFDDCLTLSPQTLHITHVRSAQTVQDGSLWLVRLELDERDTVAFTRLTRHLVTRTPPRDELAVILHGPPGGLVLAAPAVVPPVTRLDLDGGPTAASAAALLSAILS